MKFNSALKHYSRRRNLMKTIKKMAISVAATALISALSGCAGMSARDQNTAVGAGIGAVGGAILTNGSAVGTVGGAAVGAVIGNQVKP
jgi:osmotically inducible lipoprotein OsmB